MRTLFLYVFCLISCGFICGCKHTESEINKSEDLCLSWDCEYVTMSNDNSFATINLKDRFNEKDTFDARGLIGNNYLVGESLDIKIETDAKIIRAEKVTHFYPTIWAGENDNAIQYIYLFNMEYKDVQPLTISNGIIKYPSCIRVGSSGFKSYFGKITKTQLTSAIEIVPTEYQKKGTLNHYELDSWSSEIKVWNRIAREYTTGEFINSRNEPFEVNPYEIELVVTFQGADGEFIKTFQDEAIVGN